MNHDLVVVKKFREKLDRLNISDYHGLSSPGLTCYLNSVLQVLFMTEDFREAVNRHRCCSTDSASIDSELLNLFAALQRNIARTHDFTDKLGISNVYEQRDAAEYFEKILCLTNAAAAEMFKGELKHKSECLTCKEMNDCRSFFWLLPLAVEQTCSVEEGLVSFFKGEKLCRDNRMFCSQCNEKQDARFECEITQSPEVLTLLLKRFSFDLNLRRYIKLHCSVDVPKTLHMTDCEYDLYALVDHFGNLTGGHYTAQIKSFETGVWYHFNDDTVSKVKQPLFGAGVKYLRSSTAYLLMYRKVSKNPRKAEEGDEESLCTRPDVAAERGAALVSHLQPKQENLQHFKRHILKKNHNDTAGKKQTAGFVRTQTDSEEDGDRLQTQTSNFATLQKDGGRKRHENRRPLETNLQRADSIIQPNHASLKQRLNANETVWETPNNVEKTKANVKDCSTKPAESKVACGACSAALCRTAQSPFRVHEHSECNFSPELSRKSKSPKSDKEAGGKLDTKTVTKGSKTTSYKETKEAVKNREKVRKEPWR